MANALYGKAREAFLSGNISWNSADIKCLLVNTSGGGTTYTVTIDSDQHHSDIPSGAIVATSGNLTNKTVTLGVADADSVTFSSVPAGAYGAIEALVIYKDTGVSSTSPLIAYLDTASGLPVTPNGGDIVVEWDNGANKIYKL